MAPASVRLPPEPPTVAVPRLPVRLLTLRLPPVAWIVPWLVKLAGATETARPATSEAIVPWLTSVIAPPRKYPGPIDAVDPV